MNMDIPYFYVYVSDINVKDTDNIWKLKKSSLSDTIEKLERFDLDTMDEQLDLVEFSIKTPNALYSTELQESYKIFQNSNLNHIIPRLKA
ncbi:hypothetical protein [Enterococcus faecium]|uniref:hypothetical protein n=1 Tax=Enterococcus faecium TaxID=1352 RepID=UPI00211A3209|nr:hypothetical protein [Enterococcus faecium]